MNSSTWECLSHIVPHTFLKPPGLEINNLDDLEHVFDPHYILQTRKVFMKQTPRRYYDVPSGIGVYRYNKKLCLVWEKRRRHDDSGVKGKTVS